MVVSCRQAGAAAAWAMSWPFAGCACFFRHRSLCRACFHVLATMKPLRSQRFVRGRCPSATALLLLAALAVFWYEGGGKGGALTRRQLMSNGPAASIAAAAAAAQAGARCSPSLVVLVTSHKTGTAQAG